MGDQPKGAGLPAATVPTPPLTLRVAFAGTPPFAAEALRALLAAGVAVPLVLTQPDRPAGRGMHVQPSSVKQLALQHGLPVLQPRGLRLDGKWADDAGAIRTALQQAAPDVLVVAAYGLILPQWVLDLPRLGCINIHASLLPRWRGAAPIQRAIEAGDPITGISIMRMEAGLDTGPVYRMQELPIRADDTTASLHDRLAALGAQLLLQTLVDIQANTAEPTAQPSADITYAAKIDKGETWLDWTKAAAELERRVRAFQPMPGTQTRLDDSAMKIHAAKLRKAGRLAEAPGTVLAVSPEGIEVACTEGSLLLTRLQRPGGKVLDAGPYLLSHPIRPGQRFAPCPH